VVERSKARVYDPSLAGIAGSNPAGAWMFISFSRVCCQVSASGRSPVRRTPTNCRVPSCVIQKPQESGGVGLRWVVAPQKEEEDGDSF
jgi:hypothetical protein